MDIRLPLIRTALTRNEAQAAFDVVLSTWVHEGKKTAEFERMAAEFVGVKHAVAFFNGTVALHAALVAMEIGQGDEVILPSFTFFSTVSTVVQAGATPVFAEISPINYGLDPEDVARRIRPATKAIVPVHYGGLAADMTPLTDLARRHGIMILEDAAESLGAAYHGKMVGAFGRAGMFSFTPTKIITTGEGGMLVTDDSDLAQRLRLLKNHGQDRPYHHVRIGFNYRMTEMQAALGISQMERIREILKQKRAVARGLTERLRAVPEIQLPHEPEKCLHTYMLYTLRLQDRERRDALSSGLWKAGIENRVYFPPVHLQPVFCALGVRLPVTEHISDTVLSIPCHASMTEAEVDYLTSTIRSILEETP
jgi:perosamine synthetase